MKQFYFLSGLPRTGSTVLSALLNQNPEIYSSHATNLLNSMIGYKEQMKFFETLNADINPTGYFQVLKNMGENFYSHIDKPYVFDKSHLWGSDISFPYANLLNNKIKIIYPVRNVLEILASFITIIENTENNFIDNSIKAINFPVYRPINDARCDFLMSEQGSVGSCLPALANALLPEHRNMFHIVDYNDLINNPEETMNSIYEFLELPKYKHDFNNIVEADFSNDIKAYGVPLHAIKSKLEKTSKPYQEVLSQYVIDKYSNAITSLY